MGVTDVELLKKIQNNVIPEHPWSVCMLVWWYYQCCISAGPDVHPTDGAALYSVGTCSDFLLTPTDRAEDLQGSLRKAKWGRGELSFLMPLLKQPQFHSLLRLILGVWDLALALALPWLQDFGPPQGHAVSSTRLGPGPGEGWSCLGSWWCLGHQEIWG